MTSGCLGQASSAPPRALPLVPSRVTPGWQNRCQLFNLGENAHLTGLHAAPHPFLRSPPTHCDHIQLIGHEAEATASLSAALGTFLGGTIS